MLMKLNSQHPVSSKLPSQAGCAHIAGKFNSPVNLLEAVVAVIVETKAAKWDHGDLHEVPFFSTSLREILLCLITFHNTDWNIIIGKHIWRYLRTVALRWSQIHEARQRFVIGWDWFRNYIQWKINCGTQTMEYIQHQGMSQPHI